MGASFSLVVCVAPLQLKGLRGKKSTPSIGWEVPMRSHRLASESEEDRQQLKDIRKLSSVTVFLLKMLSVLRFNVMLVWLWSSVDDYCNKTPCV
jgi:hypothetical protein